MSRRVLIAGVGNLFFADDGFGVEVARRLAAIALPPGVTVMDVGIRGLHLAYELLSPPDVLLVVDVMPRGGAPGDLYVLEPELEGGLPSSAEGHGMDLPSVFATVRALGGTLPRVLIVGCEPGELGEGIGLSARVEQAIEPCLRLVHELVARELEPEPTTMKEVES